MPSGDGSQRAENNGAPRIRWHARTPAAIAARVSFFELRQLIEFAPAPFLALLGGLLGVVLGSFAATLLLRWPQGLKISAGRSRCDSCLRRLHPLELVPLASYLALRGRCRTCRSPIGRLSPTIELLAGLTGAACFALRVPLLAPFLLTLLTLAAFDLLCLWLPTALVVVAAGFALLAPPLVEGLGVGDRLAGGFAGFAVLAAVAFAFRRLTGRTGLGGGDPRLFGAIGLWCGPLQLPLLLLIACGIGFVAYAARGRLASNGKAVELPFGTYLCAATFILAFAKPLAWPGIWL